MEKVACRLFFGFSLSAGLCLSAAAGPQSSFLSKALAIVPLSSQAFEYDNLAQLRTLPDYPLLRKQYTGTPLEHAKTTFADLGVPENSLREVAIMRNATHKLCGMVSGMFDLIRVNQQATKLGYSRLSGERHDAYCSGSGTCIEFLNDSFAIFGSADDLKNISRSQHEATPTIANERLVQNVLAKISSQAQVVGFGRREDLANWIKEEICPLCQKLDLSPVLNDIHLFVYSMQLDRKAHVVLDIECESSRTATLLSQGLTAINSAYSTASNLSFGQIPWSPYDQFSATATSNVVHLALNSTIH
jgi:hypothetical protein